MAEFAARGVLRFDAVVPAAINEAFLAHLAAAANSATTEPDAAGENPHALYGALLAEPAIPFLAPGTHWLQAFEPTHPLHALLRLPEIAGAIESLVGRSAVVDHQFLHITFPPRDPARPVAQHYHQDSTIDPRHSFDIQLFYFPQAVTGTMGGTRYLPGSHLRRVSESAIARYQNLRGQQHVTCAAGTVFIFHHGLWHGGGANTGDSLRYLWKLRLAPQEPQVKLWDTQDLVEDPHHQSPIFWAPIGGPADPVHAILTKPEPWFEADTERLEYIARIAFWRRLIGDDRFDADYWLSRLENEYPPN